MIEINKKEVEDLLHNVGSKVKRSKEVAQLKGENFNIFKILGVERKENNTHSNFLSELLNPKGKHGLDDVFLKLFYNIIIPILPHEKVNVVKKLKTESVIVKTEDTEDIEGGRVDISIRKSLSGLIFIENKIDALDQPLQIVKYSKDHSKKNKIILYLTLDGYSPSNESKGNLVEGKDFFLISYKREIKEWLEKCQKQASDYPIIRETIKQYVILIKELTGQLTDQKMEKEIIDLVLKNKESFESAEAIRNYYDEARNQISKEVIQKIEKHLILYEERLKIVVSTTKDNDFHFFVKVIPLAHPKNGIVYDIGVNIELRSLISVRKDRRPIFYFCAIEQGKNRHHKYNKEFGALSDFLNNSFRISRIKSKSTSGQLTSLFNFKDFTSLEQTYFDDIESLSKDIADEIINSIKASKLKDYPTNH